MDAFGCAARWRLAALPSCSTVGAPQPRAQQPLRLFSRFSAGTPGRSSRRPRQTRLRGGPVAAGGDNDGTDARLLNLAASNFSKGLSAGEEADDLVAQSLGVEDASQLSDVQEQYKDKIKQKLEERAEELRREREARSRQFSAGKAAYAKGQYPASATLLEAALNQEGPFTQLGGEIQLWLALAYQACGREEECLDVYKALEKTHPLPAIRRQAADLRYIMEAPKLPLRPDEKVEIPVLNDVDAANRAKRSSAPRPRPPPGGGAPRRPKSWDEEFWENYKAPVYLKNRYVWVAATLVCLGLAWYSATYRALP